MANKTQGDLKQALAKRAETNLDPAQAEERPKSIKDLLNDPKIKELVQSALPNGMDLARFVTVSLQAVRANPTLHQCTATSLMAACMQAAQLGLEPGVLGHSYLVPFWNKKIGAYDVQLIIGYRGYIALAYRNPQVESIVARSVRENDEFEWHYGIDDHMIHRPALEDRGAPVRYYAVVKLKSGGHVLNVMNIQEINARRARSKSADSGPWVTDYDAMATKSVVRATVPWIPMSVQLAAAYVVDESVPTQIHEDMAAELAGRPIDVDVVDEPEEPAPDAAPPEGEVESSDDTEAELVDA